MKSQDSIQGSFDDLGTALSSATFVVVDLETTGGSPEDCAITEIGAVKIRGGEVIGEFQTLINPGTGIPPFIAVLTGITDAMVSEAPKIENVLPTFIEFCGSPESTILVAHNAPFDISFLRAAMMRSGRPWPKYRVLDTAKIARRVLTRDEVPNNKLSTLAPFFGADSQPNHRALDDAKATVDVFHGLIGRVGSLGVSTVEDLFDFSHRLTQAQQSKRHLLEGLPKGPGLYIFKGPDGEALYIGVSKNIASRVRSYFSSNEARSRVLEMIAIAESIETIPCPTVTEAEIREIRMINSIKPRYNRRSKFPEKKIWLRLTDETFPRISTVRGFAGLSDEEGWAGPFSGVDEADAARSAIYEITKIRQCTIKITSRSMKLASPCALYEMKRCDAPCVGAQSEDSYETLTQSVHQLLHGASTPLEEELMRKMKELAGDERFEDALALRNRLSSFARGVSRGQRIRSITRIPEIVVRVEDELLLIRYGRLASSAPAPSVELMEEAIRSLLLSGERIIDDESIIPAKNYEESEKLVRVLEKVSEVLLIDESRGPWSMPTRGATSIRHRLLKNSSDASSQSEWIDRMSDNRIRS
ncbi:MAG: DEDD exonuclease domain-containing protein [Actinobacteria bacterium]|nr:DEDD exonuclease domain-containing protein [Actinomycetota bacterium]